MPPKLLQRPVTLLESSQRPPGGDVGKYRLDGRFGNNIFLHTCSKIYFSSARIDNENALLSLTSIVSSEFMCIGILRRFKRSKPNELV